MRDLKLYEICSLSEMEEIREPWNRLVLSMPDATPFQTWEWNFTMTKLEKNNVRLRLIVAEDDLCQVVGIAPFWKRSTGIPGMMATEFIAGRNADYLDWLVLPPHEDVFVQHLMKWIDQHSEYRIVHLQGLRKDSVDLISRYGSVEVRPFNICLYARLPHTLAEYEKELMQKRLRQAIRHDNRVLGNEGRLLFSISRTASELKANLPVLFDLHQRRQRANGERGRFYDKRRREAFQEMSLGLSQHGLPRLGILRIDGKPAASLYNLRLLDREYGYLGGMDPTLAKYRPGNLLEHWMIGEAIKDGMQAYDLLGGNQSHKLRWTNETCETYQVLWTRWKVLSRVWWAREAIRALIYRSQWIKWIYLATFGRFQRSFRGRENAS